MGKEREVKELYERKGDRGEKRGADCQVKYETG